MNDSFIAAPRSKAAVRLSNFKKNTSLFFANPLGVVGMVIILFFLFTAFIWPRFYEYSIAEQTGGSYDAPSTANWLGTDFLGRDLFGAVIYGARISITVGVFGAAIAVTLGAIIGMVSGYSGGRVDEVMMRLTDGVMVIPTLLFIMVMVQILGPSMGNIILVIGVKGWTGTARLVRSQTLSLRERQFVERSRSFGAGRIYMISKHILPNVFPVIFAHAILATSNAIISEATLSFLGLGDPLAVSWGQILQDAFMRGAVSAGYWWHYAPPGICIVLLVLGFTFLSYSFDELLNPRLRRR